MPSESCMHPSCLSMPAAAQHNTATAKHNSNARSVGSGNRLRCIALWSVECAPHQCQRAADHVHELESVNTIVVISTTVGIQVNSIGLYVTAVEQQSVCERCICYPSCCCKPANSRFLSCSSRLKMAADSRRAPSSSRRRECSAPAPSRSSSTALISSPATIPRCCCWLPLQMKTLRTPLFGFSYSVWVQKEESCQTGKGFTASEKGDVQATTAQAIKGNSKSEFAPSGFLLVHTAPEPQPFQPLHRYYKPKYKPKC